MPTPRPLRLIRNLNRTREIVAVLVAQGFGNLVQRLRLRRVLGWWLWSPWGRQNEPAPELSTAARIRLSLESLGPAFVKFGQVISTRPDLVPADVIEELSKLREHVPPFPGDKAVELVEQELGQSIDELFLSFDRTPLAAGSLAQVHRAISMDGTPLAIKIRRPTVADVVERDLSLMYDLAALIEHRIPEARVFDPLGLVNHFARAIRREIDFQREARTMDEFRRLFEKDLAFAVPEAYLDLCSSGVLTMQFIEGISVDDHERIGHLPISAGEIAATGARVYMRQIFEFGIFHSDPHPGNVRILHDGTFCLLDYGMVGFVEDGLRDSLVDLFVGVARKDIDAVCGVLLKIGSPIDDVNLSLLRTDVRDFIGTYYGLPLEQVDVGRLLGDFLNILTSHGLRCPGDLMLLIRATVALEGTGRQLDPHFNLANHLGPFIEQLLANRYDPRRIAGELWEEAGDLAHIARTLPGNIARVVEKLSKDEVEVQLNHAGINRLITELDRTGNRVVISLAMSAMIVASALLLHSNNQISWFAAPIFIVSSLLGLWLIYGIIRSGSL
ncbi:ABC1 kinase family protein [Calycomorphotria hydatis]|uniref:ABC1 atypical kinase-like domain-containing protein n=1 Tax=Calycomorphotria hydatis TaxID=2528027 RepID=A0A517T597_9PLAN|nr:AarF/ABC1/UbiB kinase family protein [Calycomorphotria hydatis]QDT63549.1 putative protein kinase UbiB [Calycomorphotria hydatis]